MGVLDLFRLESKVALVTGGGQGIGRAFALALAESGAEVVVADVNEESGRRVTEEVAARGRRSVFIKSDVGVEEDVHAMVCSSVRELGGLDILVNNANAGGPRDADWMGRTLRAVLLSSYAAAEEMKKRGRGKIVNIASISGYFMNHSTTYCTAKAGIIMMTRCLAVELARHNINVNSISPSYTLSPARRRDNEEARDRVRSLHPLGWYERPEDLCGTLIYLVSEASNYVTGRDIIVDGGHTLNVWFDPPPRVAPPLVSPEEEIVSLKHDLEVLGIRYDEQSAALE